MPPGRKMPNLPRAHHHIHQHIIPAPHRRIHASQRSGKRSRFTCWTFRQRQIRFFSHGKRWWKAPALALPTFFVSLSERCAGDTAKISTLTCLSCKNFWLAVNWVVSSFAVGTAVCLLRETDASVRTRLHFLHPSMAPGGMWQSAHIIEVAG